MAIEVKDIIKYEVKPALGCTEPTAIALGAAAAASLLPGGGAPEDMEIWLDPNLFKNGLAVSIPNTGGLSGLDLAAALGALAGDPEAGMEVLAPVKEKDVEHALSMVRAGRVRVNLLSDHRGLHVKTRIRAGEQEALSVIDEFHDNITVLSLDGHLLHDHPLLIRKNQTSSRSAGDLEEGLRNLTIREMVAMLGDLDREDLDFILQGVEMNMKLAEYGLAHRTGLAVGSTLDQLAKKGLIQRDMVLDARILTAAASDARMAGVSLPAMSSAGSGNHGLTAILPIKAVADHIGADQDNLCRAVVLSHLITAAVKAYTGRLAAICACSVAAGAGAAGGIAWLLGGDWEQIGGAVDNIIEDLAGVICDGAKNSCSLKLDTAAATAVKAALFSLQGLRVKSTDGIVGESPEKTIRNIGVLSSQGMTRADQTILEIMLDKLRVRGTSHES